VVVDILKSAVKVEAVPQRHSGAESKFHPEKLVERLHQLGKRAVDFPLGNSVWRYFAELQTAPD
jgi:hypothetical protein